MNIQIASFADAEKLINKKPNFYRVVSISSPLEPLYLNKTKELLHLHFDDITKMPKNNTALKLRLATKEDCAQAIQFLRIKGNIIVHCHHGRSRSTAIVLGFLLSKYTNEYKTAVDKLLEIQPWATPNEYIIELICSVIGLPTNFDKKVVLYLKETRKQFLSKIYSKEVND